MKVLKFTVVVRNPDTLVAVALKAGEKVPAWAKDLVHPDDLVSDAAEDEDDEGEDDDTEVPYAKRNNDDLKDLIAERNEGRADEDQIVPDGTKKADLVAALEADDAAQA